MATDDDALVKKRIIDLDEVSTVASGSFVVVDSTTAGTKKFDLKRIADGTVIGPDSVNTENIVDDAVTTDKIADGAITADKLDNGSVTENKINDNAITSSKIADEAITSDKILDGSVTADKIVNGGIATDKLSDGSVTSNKIANEAINSNKLSDDSVTSSKIADNAITGDKIGDDAVSSSKIVDGAIDSNKISNSAITSSKIADDAVVSSKISNGAITTDKIANNAVTSSKVVDGAISSDKLANSSVTTDKIADGAVTLGKIASNSGASSSRDGLMSSADKTKLDQFGEASAYALKSDLTNIYKYKGSVATEALLPSSGQTIGDVYNIIAASSYGAAGMNVAWNGTGWDALGEKYSIEDGSLVPRMVSSGYQFMSDADKTKLDGIETGANKTVVDSTLSGSSTNPVQNGIIKDALDAKAPLASPTFTGTPSAPTASSETNNTQLATTAFAHAVADAKFPISTTDISNGAVTLDKIASDSAASSSRNGLMSSTDKTKLDGIETGAEVNQNAFSTVHVGSTDISADSKTDTLTLIAGDNVELVANDQNDSITINATGGGGADIDLGITGGSAGQYATIKTVDQDGAPTEWESDGPMSNINIFEAVDDGWEPESYNLVITVTTTDFVTVTGQTVTIRRGGPSGQVIATAEYNGSPVTFELLNLTPWYAEVSDTLVDHFGPSTASGVIDDGNAAATLTYSSLYDYNTAAKIKTALNNNEDLSFLIGKQQVGCSKGQDTLIWNVGHYDATNRCVVLFLSKAIGPCIFEPAQALGWFENGLAEENYYFTHNNTNYYFTLTSAIPADGQLRATTSAFTTYASREATTALETGTVSTTEIPGAVFLGTTASNSGPYSLNHMDRVNYGSNNIGESAIFQWLNSTAAANIPVTRINNFSRPYSYNVAGFMADMDQDFLDCIEEFDWPCSANNVYEAPASMGGISTKGQQYTIKGKFCLPSEMEIFGSNTYSIDDGTSQWDFFVGSESTDRIMYDGNNTARYVFLRSPRRGNGYNVTYIGTSGNCYYGDALYGFFVVPACVIKADE